MPRSRLVMLAAGITFALAASAPLTGQQLPLSPAPRTGAIVTPAFEGWYPNKDGTFSISFGYYNRNSEEALEVPIGPDNSIGPGEPNQGQPTHFEPKRHWGVFAVKVPADFGKKEVVWTLKVRGQTYAIPGNLHPNWQIDALEGEAGSGNTPPVLKFERNGTGRRGAGRHHGRTDHGERRQARHDHRVGEGRRQGRQAASRRAGRGAVPVTLTWFKHQGPGTVTFTPPTARVPVTGGSASTTATFSEPGDYILRVRANDASGVAGAGHAQCCWTNGFVKVTVNR